MAEIKIPLFPKEPMNRPLKIVIVTQQDPFYIPLFFQELIQLSIKEDKVEITGVLIQNTLGEQKSANLVHRIWSLYGTIGFLRMSIQYMAAKIWGSVCRIFRFIGLQEHSIEGYCRSAGIAILRFPKERSLIPNKHGKRLFIENNVNGYTFLRYINDTEVDLIVSVSASQIFSERTLLASPMGCINLHNSPLPHYRGMLPNFWQMYHNEKESTLTIHYMTRNIDKGILLLQEGTPIDTNMSLEQLIAKTKKQSAHALWKLLLHIHSASVKPTSYSSEKGSYFSWPTREEAKEFCRRGKKVW